MAADEPREAVTQLYGYAVFLLARTGAAPPAGLERPGRTMPRPCSAATIFQRKRPLPQPALRQEVLQAAGKNATAPTVRGPLVPYLVLGLKEAMLMKSIRFLALLLCAALLLPLVPVHAAQSGGSFYLTASTAGQTLIEPVAVPYTAGQTIRDALRGSGYAFGGIDTAFITDIEGVAGNFTVYYDGGAYSLDAIASPETVTAVVFSERERGFPALLDAVTELGRFRERTDHVQNYPAAQQRAAARPACGRRTRRA